MLPLLILDILTISIPFMFDIIKSIYLNCSLTKGIPLGSAGSVIIVSESSIDIESTDKSSEIFPFSVVITPSSNLFSSKKIKSLYSLILSIEEF